MASRAVVTAFHKYMDFGGEYFASILDFYLKQMKQYSNEYDRLYLIDSNWGIPDSDDYTTIKLNPSLRYFDAYKASLPYILEDLVLFTDNDTVIYKKGCIDEMFFQIDDSHTSTSVSSIYDSCGMYKTDKLNGKNKFCLYWFATRKELLMKYRDVEWGPNLPEHETIGKLTEKMLEDGVSSWEWPEDKNSIYFDGVQDGESGKNTGVYHVRAGSTPACLLAWRDHRPETYRDYLKNQPKREIIRHCAWYWHMGGNALPIIDDLGISRNDWIDYCSKFMRYHNL